MEKSLSARSTEFSAGYSTQKIRFSQIRDLLADSEAVVEIVKVRGFQQDFTKDIRYAILIMKKGLDIPSMVVLENGTFLETKVLGRYRISIAQNIPDDNSYKEYWSRIEAEVKDKKMIYVSPDGVFNQVNLNTLKTPSGEYLIRLHNFALLGNSKDLISIKTKSSRDRKSVV